MNCTILIVKLQNYIIQNVIYIFELSSKFVLRIMIKTWKDIVHYPFLLISLGYD